MHFFQIAFLTCLFIGVQGSSDNHFVPPPGPVFPTDSIYKKPHDFSQTLFYKSPLTNSKFVEIHQPFPDQDNFRNFPKIPEITQESEAIFPFSKPSHSFSPSLAEPVLFDERPPILIRRPTTIIRKPSVFRKRRPKHFRLKMPRFRFRKNPFGLL